MSENYPDYQKRQKKRQDYKGSKKSNGSYPVYYESKNQDKNQRDYYDSYKGHSGGSYRDDYYGKGSRYDNTGGYRGKPQYKHRKGGNDQVSNIYKKKVTKLSKIDIMECFQRAGDLNGLNELIENYPDAFSKTKIIPVNEGIFQLDPNDALMPRLPHGRSYGNNPPEGTEKEGGNKGLELYDLGQERFDPIQALRSQLKLKDGTKNSGDNQDGDGDVIGGEDYEDDFGEREHAGHRDKRDDDEEYDDEGENYSDVDALFEKKLKNNEYQPNEDVFEELLGLEPQKKQDIEELENDERPVWEDVDTQKVIQEIQNKEMDFISTLPQDKKAIFGNKYDFDEDKFFDNKKIGFDQSLGFDQKIDSNKNPFFTDDSGIDFSSFTMGPEPIQKKSYDDFFAQQEDIFLSALNQFSTQKQSDSSFDEAAITSFMNSLNLGIPSTLPQKKEPAPILPPQLQAQITQPQEGGLNMGQPKPMIPTQPGSFMTNQLPQFKREAQKDSTTPTNNPPRNRPHPMYPSFIFRYYSPDYDQPLWRYIDLQKKIQGPYSGRLMDEWYSQGHLPLDLKVTVGENNGYKTIRELADYIVQKTINGDGPPPPKKGETLIMQLIKNRPELANLATNNENLPLKAKTIDQIEQQLTSKQDFRDMSPTYRQPKPMHDYGSKNQYHRSGSHGDHDHKNQKNKNKQNNVKEDNRDHHHHHDHKHQNQNTQKQAHGQGHIPPTIQSQPQSQILAAPVYQIKPKTIQASNSSTNQSSTNTNAPTNQPNTNPLMMLAGSLGNTSNPNDMTNQLKNMLGLIKPTPNVETKPQHPPKIDTSDFPSLGEATKK